VIDMRLLGTLMTAASLFAFTGLWQAFADEPHPSSKIDIAYQAPFDKRLDPVMERLKSRRVLEQLSEFISPLRLPHAFHLIAKQCFVVNAFYSPEDWSLTLCYELIDTIVKDAPKPEELKAGLKPSDVVAGEVAFVLLHELGHAAFDMFQVPVFGREEDAADQMAVFMAMQFSPELARTITTGNFYFFNHRDPANWTDYADEHGTDSQRRYNGLCWAYGGNSQMFKDYIDDGLLPKERAKDCIEEYRHIRDAFNRTVLPFIDEKLRQEVEARDWFKTAISEN
jgi:hypothetical protein